MPSLRYSVLASPLTLAKGSTARESMAEPEPAKASGMPRSRGRPRSIRLPQSPPTERFCVEPTAQRRLGYRNLPLRWPSRQRARMSLAKISPPDRPMTSRRELRRSGPRRYRVSPVAVRPAYQRHAGIEDCDPTAGRQSPSRIPRPQTRTGRCAHPTLWLAPAPATCRPPSPPPCPDW
jgi:hypothetical protein